MKVDVVLHDRERCRRRSALAAMRGIEATPVKFYGSAPPEDVEGAEVISASGDLPTGADAVNRINSILGLAGPRRLRDDQIYVRYLEAGNTNYIKSRLMFLAPSTLANIARAADQGFAFMNSHRTGGFSSDPEMPLGRTFAGRHEKLAIRGGREFHRTMVGFYMVKGQKPNGESGPSTDALAAGIDAGTIFDVSLGLKGPARLVCDVCDESLDERDEEGNRLCPHVPGTRRALSDDQREAQRQRGVDDGVATYSIHDATAGEVSAVFDGAVPGAGFRRMLSACQRGELAGDELAEARAAYAPLLAARFDRTAGRARPQPKRSVFVMAKRRKGETVSAATLFDRIQSGEVDPADISLRLAEDDEEVVTPQAVPSTSGSGTSLAEESVDNVARLREELRIEREAREKAEAARLKERRDAALAAVDRDADAAVEAMRDRLTGESAKTFRAALLQAGRDDLDHPLADGARRFDAIKALQAAAAPHGHDKERISHRKPEALPNYGSDGNPDSDLKSRAASQNSRHMPKAARRPQGAGAGA